MKYLITILFLVNLSVFGQIGQPIGEFKIPIHVIHFENEKQAIQFSKRSDRLMFYTDYFKSGDDFYAEIEYDMINEKLKNRFGIKRRYIKKKLIRNLEKYFEQ